MKCLHCGFENRAGACFCGRCGQTLQATPPAPAPLIDIICPICGAAARSVASFCGRCGNPLTAEPIPSLAAQPSPPVAPSPPPPSTPLQIHSEVPLVETIKRVIDTTMWVLFLNPISLLVSDLIWIVLVGLVVSSELRSYSDSVLFDTIVVGALIAVCLGWGFLLTEILSPWFNRLVFGKPVLAELGGLPSRIFFTAMKCAAAIKYEFKAEDWETVKNFNLIDAEVTEETLKLAYREYRESKYGLSPDFESKWAKVWNEQILKLGTEGITLQDSLSDDNLAFRIVPRILDATTNLVAPLVKGFQLVMIYLILRYLNGSSELLTIIQIGVFLSFIISITWFIHHSYQLVEIPFLGFYEQVPEEVQMKFSDKVGAFHGSKVRPTKITVKKRYFSLVRDHFLKTILATILNTLLALVLVGITLLVGLIWFSADMGDLLSWYRDFSIGLLLLPPGFIAGYYLTFLILQNVRRVLAPVAAGLMGAVLPFALEYLTTGHLELGEMENAITAAVAGISTLLVTAITSQIRKDLGEEA